VVGVEQWAELRREHFVGGKSIKQLARSTRLSRNTIRRALPSERPPSYGRAPRASVLEPFKDEIHRLLREDPKLPGVRVRELLAPLGCRAGKTVVDDYLREVRPLFSPPPRTFQRTVYRSGELVQFDVWQPRRELPVGHGQTRRGWVVIACRRVNSQPARGGPFSTGLDNALCGFPGGSVAHGSFLCGSLLRPVDRPMGE
jgi:hypothetical protein